VGWLREVAEVARGHSPEVTQVTGIYFDSLQRRLIAASDGRWVDEERPRIRLVAQVVAKRGDVIQTGWDGPAACAGVEFLDAHPPRVTAERAATRAVTMLDSIPAPAGEMAVVGANGRRESYAHPPIVRMTNTNILPGKEDPDQILRSTAHGIYVRGLGGGQVNPATGDFVFGVSEGYLIENGQVTTPVRGANLIGRA